MFRLDMAAIRKTASSSRLMANAANSANLSRNESVSGSPLAKLAKLAISHGAKDLISASNNADVLEPEPPADPVGWHELDAAYMEHHFNCKTCIAAGRGSRYGMRCGAGAALWHRYSHAATELAPNRRLQ